MRVLHVDPERAWGGGEVQVLALVRELALRGHDSTVAAHPGGPLARAAAAAGARVVPLAIANHFDLRAALVLRRLAPGFDVVHFHTARAHALAPLSRGRGARLVVTRRMDYVPAGGPYVRFLYNRAVDAVIAISEGVRAALVRVGVRTERIRVVPSGIDAPALAAPPQAGAAVRREWGLCGEGRQAEALARAAAALDGAVEMVGFRRDVAACLAAADVVALPSLQEGLGVAALEAMAAGRPVVASRVGGLTEAVVHEETGLLVPPGDPTALATALVRLARDPGLRARLGAAGRARVLARYTAARMAEGTLACYEDRPCA